MGKTKKIIQYTKSGRIKDKSCYYKKTETTEMARMQRQRWTHYLPNSRIISELSIAPSSKTTGPYNGYLTARKCLSGSSTVKKTAKWPCFIQIAHFKATE